ncbi:MAG: replication-associated recombination protein A [Candidatus Pacebacteria bacterium]|jgi:putative ATPase|nr:replication-associated recombination protein A [Candidatus Paceibacterota bacterium]MBT4652196.1 replication-associated recombination protein A [Candidatus Paceibacterota bacterium]MBT6756627.1 replication-associated recombination protein A [Candidatus Paceibacterota bacterium]MBT6920877.1 replication-associated recombination protein A [Candidatus Paceibacterota bacterium]
MTDSSSIPLAARLRPTNLDEFVGQKHLVGEDKPLRITIEMGVISSMIFWGPPGVGKTTLAKILARQTGHNFVELSAVSAGKADIRKVVEETKQQRQLTESYTTPILFLDEIHRFNKAQQDYLLPFVEDGTLILIGATTENPSFQVISPLLSRARVYVLESLKDEEMEEVIERALSLFKKETKKKVSLAKKASEWLLRFADGDARQLLTIMEYTFQLYKNLKLDSLKNALQSQHLRYDQHGEEHHNTISAFIKSMRGSDADAAVYYLARMVAAGEDPLFIARRMVVFASEDIGMAQPTALVVANEVFKSCQTIGYPECAINLSHGAIYLAKAKKDRRAYDALRAAQADVAKSGNLPIPMELRNPVTSLMKQQGYGKGYEMYPGKNKSLLPDKLKNKKYF